MNICFTSYRYFADGPITQPIPESDPVNILYALGGTYLSFYTLKELTEPQLREKLSAFDLVIVALDTEAIELVQRIVEACPERAATYSEGHLGDYQQLAPAGQVAFLKAINAAAINFLYWEKYVPFYQALTQQPVEYLPYPYLLEQVRAYQMPMEQRPRLVAIPSGLAGHTRNGLASLAVIRRLLQANLIEKAVCWLDVYQFEQDAQAINHFLFSAPFSSEAPRPRFAWRKWLLDSRLDYRPLLKVKARLQKARPSMVADSTVTLQDKVMLHRRQAWLDYVAQLAPARLLIDLNNRETVGRNALECAALGIACISTSRSDMHARLFPYTLLNDSWDVDGAVALSQRLLTDQDFYATVLSYADNQINRFSVEAFRQRFTEMQSRYPHVLGEKGR